jgi:peptide deformylase
MIVNKIPFDREVTEEDITKYKELTSKLDNSVGYTALDVGLDLPIVSINFGGEYEELVLVNPVISEASEELVVYYERDARKGKVRKTVRHQKIKVNTSNLGIVEFEPSKSEWKSQDDYMNDEGLFECILAQRLIDAINGVDVTDSIRAYNPQISKKETPGRNQRVMVKSPEGEMEFMKYKKALPLIEQGYEIV